MSGIAGIIHFDGRPVEPGEIERMTASMAHRGPDGIRHWVKGNVALGHCQMCTTPESLEETQPWANEDESLVLVMDGRVDNWEELRAELLGRGARLRNRSDAELVLRAYEEWGEDSTTKIVGEFTFQIWDSRRKILFGARDVAGTKNYYYHHAGAWFGFSSEIKGLRALGWIEESLNESRLLGFLVPAYDRADEVGTLFEGILRLPAGHAMAASKHGVRTWRYWDPSGLPELKAASLDDCAEGFAEQLRIAVRCRLRSTLPLASMLSGGLDSSSVVALIQKEFRDQLHGPLRTITLTDADRGNCLEHQHAREVIGQGCCEPHVIDSSQAAEHYEGFWDWAKSQDEPFTTNLNHTYFVAYRYAARLGLRSVLDGMAGDCCFQMSPHPIQSLLTQSKWVPAVGELIAMNRVWGDSILSLASRYLVRPLVPERLRALVRQRRRLNAGSFAEPPIASNERIQRWDAAGMFSNQSTLPGGDTRTVQAIHSRNFTTGCLSFAQERNSLIAASFGVETRSPFADRRVIEYAISMPVEGKLLRPSYKEVLRRAMAGVLPRKTLGRTSYAHPGPPFTAVISRHFEGTLSRLVKSAPACAANWVDAGLLNGPVIRGGRERQLEEQFRLWAAAAFCEWLGRAGFRAPGTPLAWNQIKRMEQYQ
ncbi:MAG: hypothetical protein IH602_14955 [Bryobacteraceae bacterium]|nr:hypothetical protein [Bryobacteraceae bacterium]